MRTAVLLSIIALSLFSCRNRDINEGEEFLPREIDENYDAFHFNKITYDGIEYLITERDNNNPHEGFGFMAYRGRKLEAKQDSLMAHLLTMQEFQKRIYARLYNLSIDEVDKEFEVELNENLKLLQRPSKRED